MCCFFVVHSHPSLRLEIYYGVSVYCSSFSLSKKKEDKTSMWIIRCDRFFKSEMISFEWMKKQWKCLPSVLHRKNNLIISKLYKTAQNWENPFVDRWYTNYSSITQGTSTESWTPCAENSVCLRLLDQLTFFWWLRQNRLFPGTLL